MSSIERFLRSLDARQRRWNPAAFVVAVFKKYGDDRGGQLSALISFYAFLSFFPLTLVVITATAFFSQRNPDIAQRIRDSSLSQFPVVGAELTGGERALHGSAVGLGIGLIGLLWGGFGGTQILQYAFHEVWHVPHKDRPSFVVRTVRGIAVFGLLAAGILGSAILGLLGTIFHSVPLAGPAGLFGAFGIMVALYLGIFWLMSPRDLKVIELLPGVLFAAFGWQVLQTIGIRLVTHQLRRSSQLYGSIGAALGLIGFFLIGSQLLLYGLEITVVHKQRLWPRSILQPPLTEPDQRLLEAMAKQEERRPEEHVSVTFRADP